MSDLVPPDQNKKWKRFLSQTQLTGIVARVKERHGLKATPQGFSWRNLVINNGESAKPTAMNQGKSELCIVYSSLGLFQFQRNLLATEVPEARDFEPSKEYMIGSLNETEEKTSVDFFLKELADNNLTDEEEFARVNYSLTKRQKKRFAVDYEYIEPTLDDFVPAVKEAIEVAGGVLINMVVYKVDKNNRPILDKAGKKIPREIFVPEIAEGRKKIRKVSKTLAHVVFGYGWESEGEKTAFNYLNSYGVHYKDDQGHDICTDLSDICEVFVPQLAFKRDGFRKYRTAGLVS